MHCKNRILRLVDLASGHCRGEVKNFQFFFAISLTLIRVIW